MRFFSNLKSVQKMKKNSSAKTEDGQNGGEVRTWHLQIGSHVKGTKVRVQGDKGFTRIFGGYRPSGGGKRGGRKMGQGGQGSTKWTEKNADKQAEEKNGGGLLGPG